MFRFRKLVALTVVAVVVAVFGAPAQVHAAFKLRYSVDGGAFTTIDGSATNSVTTSVDGLIVTASANGSTSPSLTLMDTSVNGNLSAAHKIVVETTFTGLKTPPPQILSYIMTGSILPLGAGTLTMQDWVDSANGEFTTPGAITTGALSPPASGSIGFSVPTPYSVTQRTIIDVTGSQASISSDNNLQITSPVPAGFVLLLSSAPVLGLTWLRRRKTKEPEQLSASV